MGDICGDGDVISQESKSLDFFSEEPWSHVLEVLFLGFLLDPPEVGPLIQFIEVLVDLSKTFEFQIQMKLSGFH